MWIKVENQYNYKIAIAQDYFSVGVPSSDILTTSAINYKSDEELNSIYYIPNVGYVISEKAGDDINLSSTIPQMNGGVYSLDTSKSPTSKATIYKDANDNYIANEGDYFRYFGSKIIPNDNIHNLPRLDRNGVIKTFYNTYKQTSGSWNDEILASSFIAGSGIYTTFMTTQAESDSGITSISLRNDAYSALQTSGVSFQYSAAESWDGWFSETLTGEYTAFGNATGVKKVGHYRYLDEENNTYDLDFEITENEDTTYSVTSQIDGKTYSANTRPTDSNTTFSDGEGGTLELTFSDYVLRNLIKTFFENDRITINA